MVGCLKMGNNVPTTILDIYLSEFYAWDISYPKRKRRSGIYQKRGGYIVVGDKLARIRDISSDFLQFYCIYEEDIRVTNLIQAMVVQSALEVF